MTNGKTHKTHVHNTSRAQRVGRGKQDGHTWNKENIFNKFY